MNVDKYILIAESPDNFMIQTSFFKCVKVLSEHKKILCSVSGGADSDIMLDMILRCGGKGKTDFVFFNTGLEYKATLEHLEELEKKYNIEIIRCKPIKPIPTCTQQYGVPFWSKRVSEFIYRLQSNGFKWEDKPFDELLTKYPNCKSALQWWCNANGEDSLLSIRYIPYLKEFLISNPPPFKISNKCCEYAKKKVSHYFKKGKDYDLECVGLRKAEGGARAIAYKNCFTAGEDEEADSFRPIWYLRDADKKIYSRHYKLKHSKCYTEYGLKRTGCFGCPFGKEFEQELLAIKSHEPKLFSAAISIFGDSYEYTRKYMAFRNEMKQKKRTMEVRPITFKVASDFVNANHRHHTSTAGCKFCIGLYANEALIGCAICGRSVSRNLDDGLTCEINRLCTDGTKNACSMLYGASCRVAKEMGYKKIITYILQSENGASLKASNFTCDGIAGGTHWTGVRDKGQDIPREIKTRWHRDL